MHCRMRILEVVPSFVLLLFKLSPELFSQLCSSPIHIKHKKKERKKIKRSSPICIEIRRKRGKEKQKVCSFLRFLFLFYLKIDSLMISWRCSLKENINYKNH